MNEYLRRYIKAITNQEKINAGFLLTQSYGFHLESNNGGFHFGGNFSGYKLDFYPTTLRLDVTHNGDVRSYIGVTSINRALQRVRDELAGLSTPSLSIEEKLQSLEKRVVNLESIINAKH